MNNLVAAAELPTGAYAERIERPPGSLDRFAAAVVAPLLRRRAGAWTRWAGLPAMVDAASGDLARLSDAALREQAAAIGSDLRRHGFADPVVARAFALVREAASRTIGQRHFDVQLIGGRVLLAGQVAEMNTGEGKTLTATLAATTAALAGIPVHVVTVNDYLASRDADRMGPIFRALGVSVSAVTHGIPPAARRSAYEADVTYVSNKELAFDYLRDRLVLGHRASRIELQLERLAGSDVRSRRLVLRGLHYAIVDEADSVFVDEARTPLIISAESASGGERHLYTTAMALADQLRPGSDFTVDGRQRDIQLTDAGMTALADLAEPLGGVWRGRLRREELTRQALVARHLLERDQHYLVMDGKVQLVDEFTGRVMADRSWEHGLQQMVEVKEDCAGTSPLRSLARISYQRFFRRYLRLSGMTGTGREVGGELWSVYRLPVVSIPTHRPLCRRFDGDRVFATAAARWDAVVARTSAIHETGRPVLVGTRSVAASEHLSRLLDRAGLPHEVLNARQDAREAEIVADAGLHGRITVATNMAGRGTDIALGPGVQAIGGLHVIATERHEARRIDRQLFGRAGRQGDPGSFETIASLEDELASYAPGWFRLAARFARPDGSVPLWIARMVVRLAQRAAEATHERARVDLLRFDEQLDSTLAFSGRLE
jgi:preprotein translocase subunit SecA